MSIRPEEIKSLVRQAVTRTLGESSGLTPNRKQILSAEDVMAMPANSVQTVGKNVLITPLARQAAMERHIRLEQQADGRTTAPVHLPTHHSNSQKVVAIGADHGGFE
ncbi:MAG: hypothetical protein ACE5EY_09695, partial [Anaerolineae bacterium]